MFFFSFVCFIHDLFGYYLMLPTQVRVPLPVYWIMTGGGHLLPKPVCIFSLHRILVTTYLCFIYFIIYLSSLGQTYPQYFYRTRLRVSYYTHIPVTYFLYYSHFIYVRSVLFRSNTVVLSSHPTEITFIYVTV